MTGLVESARSVVDQALSVYRAEPADADTVWALSVLSEARARLDEPLRVALAGTLKAGKSTLLNALVGERVAATDAGECTRVVTWYHDAPAASVAREAADGSSEEIAFHRGPEGLEIDAGAIGTPDDGSRLLVGWPSRGLAEHTLIDTPGLDSAHGANSARTVTFVTPEDRPSGADVVVYLMRHAHPSDVRFLEAFADLAAGGAGGLGGVGAAGTVVVLGRADEVGGGRLDALTTAGQVAAAYAEDPLLRPLCQTVVAVDGLLAETGRTLRQSEFTALRALARAPRAEIDAMLLSVDRFAAETLPPGVTAALAEDPDAPVLDAAARRALLARLGLYGVRAATSALRRGLARGQGVTDSPALAAELVRRSGLDQLREVLRTRVTERADVHKARSALLAVELVLARAGRPASQPVLVELERVLAGAHEFTEQRQCTALRAGEVVMPAGEAAEAERLLGGDGPSPQRRLGLAPVGAAPEGAAPDDGVAPAADWRPAALEALDRWRGRAESPLSSRAVAEVSRSVVRSLEAMVAPPTVERPVRTAALVGAGRVRGGSHRSR